MISGGNRGIGAAITTALAERGWLLSLGVRTPDRVAATGDRLVQRYDAREPGSERAWVAATAARFGRIDAVVNNAGIMIPKSVVEATDPDLDAILEVNVKAPLRLVREAWPHLTASGEGRVVTIVSLSGKRVKTAGSGLYAVSKFAALGLAHAIRHAGWEKGVRSTALCPGLVATDMARGITSVPPEAMTRPEDLARIVALVLELPNTASVAEIPVNALLDESY
jgi:NAD(P)-dependent dehydrogenase (short-subunit alcohol dehydrogenase family)